MFGSLTARLAAAGAVAGAVCVAGCGGGTASVEHAGAAATVPVDIRLAPTHGGDALARGAIVVRLRPASGGEVRVRAQLDEADGSRSALGATDDVKLAGDRWQDVLVPLGGAGRAALARCPRGRVVVSVRDPDYGGARSAGSGLRLDPPGCARFFAARTFWNTAIPAGAALDPNSRGITTELLRQVRKGLRSGPPPTINTVRSAPPIVTVGAQQPKVRVHLDRPPDYAPELASALASVPLPPWAQPSPGRDSELIVWQPATDTLWEFWLLRRAADGWHAKWGGRLRHVSSGPGLFTESHEAWGESASGLPLAGGVITPRELRRGTIDHALGLGIPLTRLAVFARPASRTDGAANCPHAVPEGARFRLDPDLDIGALGLPRPVAAMARAVQRYGLIVRDRSGAVAFYAQNANSMAQNPYPALFGGQTPQKLVAQFPWSRLELMRMQLGREPGPQLPPPGGGLSGCL